MPMLPCLVADETWHERGLSYNTTRVPFSRLNDEICLACASPLNTDCGFSNIALRRVQDEVDGPQRWRIETLACMCTQCDEHSNVLGVADDDAYRRGRLVERHRFCKIDQLLGVDDPIEEQREFEHNTVPVLELRRLILDELCWAWDDNELAVDREFYPLLFCSFPRTVAWLASRSPAALRCIETLAGDRAAVEARCRIDWPDGVDLADGDHWMLAALVVRVTAAYRLSDKLQETLSYGYETNVDTQWGVLQLQLFADTHLDLNVLCDMFGRYSDAWLETPLQCNMMQSEKREGITQTTPIINEVVAMTPLQISYPHPLRCVYSGEMVDATNAAASSNLWSDIQPRNSSQVASFVHVFLCKAGNHRCMLREFDVMLCRELGNYPMMIAFVMNLLECFQLGNYPGERDRPRWRFRKLVRRTYHYDRFTNETWCALCNKDTSAACPKCEGRVPTSRDKPHQSHLCDLCSFIRSVKLEIFLAVKEFYVYQIHCQRTVEALLESESGWIEHGEIVTLACNDARRIMNRACSTRNVTSGEVHERVAEAIMHLELLHDANKSSNKRLYKGVSLYRLFLSKMNSIAAAKCTVKQWTGCQQPQDFLIAPKRRAELDPEIAKNDKLADLLQCDVPLEHLGGKRWCDQYRLEHINALAKFCAQSGDLITSTLSMIGLSPRAQEILHLLHFNSEIRDMPDNATENYFKELFDKHRVDFHIFHYMLAQMRLYDQVRVRPLDANTAFAQGRALRLRYHIAPWDRIPDTCADVYFCRHCRVLYDTTVEAPATGTLKQRRATHDACVDRGGDMIELVNTPCARGISLAFYDNDRRALMCSRDSDSSNSKKFSKGGFMDEPMWLNDKKRATSIRSAREAARPCRSCPLEKVSLLGRILELGGTLFVLCTICASPCIFSDATMSNTGPTCGRHYRLFDPRSFRSLRQYVSPLTRQVREFAPRMLHTVPETIVAAPKSVGFASPTAEKLGVVSTPIIDGEMFTIVQQELYRSSGGVVMQNLRAERKSTFFDQQRTEKERDKGTEALEQELIRKNTDMFTRTGSLTQKVVLVCAYCAKRCELNEEFVRLTVNNCDGALTDFLWRKPLNSKGLVDVWLCKNDFHRSLKMLREDPVPLCSRLYFNLNDRREESLQRIKKRQFRN